MGAVIVTAPHQPPKTEAIRIRRGLTLYKQPKSAGRGSPNWYARAYLDVGGRKLHAKSTGTADVRIAQEKAEEFLTDLRIQQRHEAGIFSGGPILKGAVVNRFDKVAEAWLDLTERQAGSA